MQIMCICNVTSGGGDARRGGGAYECSRDDARQNDQPSNVYGSRFSRLSDCSFSTASQPLSNLVTNAREQKKSSPRFFLCSRSLLTKCLSIKDNLIIILIMIEKIGSGSDLNRCDQLK